LMCVRVVSAKRLANARFMLKPILIGSSPLCAKTDVLARAGEIRAAPMPVLTCRRVMRWVMSFLPNSVYPCTLTGARHGASRVLNQALRSHETCNPDRQERLGFEWICPPAELGRPHRCVPAQMSDFFDIHRTLACEGSLLPRSNLHPSRSVERLHPYRFH